MHGRVSQAGMAAIAIAISLCATPAGAIPAGHKVRLAQNADPGKAAEPSQSSAAAAPAAVRANSPEQIRKAQIELRRLDCFQGRVDGKLGTRTREAVKKFWASAKQPDIEVNITDELISDLAERGDNFCRPPRRFFGFGGHSTLPLPFAPGMRPIPAPVPSAPQPPPEAAH